MAKPELFKPRSQWRYKTLCNYNLSCTDRQNGSGVCTLHYNAWQLKRKKTPPKPPRPTLWERLIKSLSAWVSNPVEVESVQPNYDFENRQVNACDLIFNSAEELGWTEMYFRSHSHYMGPNPPPDWDKEVPLDYLYGHQ